MNEKPKTFREEWETACLQILGQKRYNKTRGLDPEWTGIAQAQWQEAVARAKAEAEKRGANA